MSKVSDAWDHIQLDDMDPDHRKALLELREQIRYWSYCTWQGMQQWCPEKKEDLRDFLADLDIDPYSRETDYNKPLTNRPPE